MPNIFKNYYTHLNEFHTYLTRNTMVLSIPSAKRDVFYRSVKCRGVVLWNEHAVFNGLVNDLPSINVLKLRLKKHLLSIVI